MITDIFCKHNVTGKDRFVCGIGAKTTNDNVIVINDD